MLGRNTDLEKGDSLMVKFALVWLPVLSLALIGPSFAQSTLPCDVCHTTQMSDWMMGRHANTQNDVAGELAANWAGQTPDSVINGSSAEDCVACHSPLAVTTGSGMTEVQVMGHFFTTSNGRYTDSTHAADTANWPHVGCNTCHNVPSNHPSSLPTFAIFNSATAQYDSIQNTSILCGQCHGTLRFPGTDHRVYDAWKLSRHGHGGQQDVAGELAGSWAGKTPNDVINGPDAENCVACHAPTAVQMNGGMSASQVLANFFTTTGGAFTDSTHATDTLHWPDLSCATCHNPHRPDTLSFFNSDSSKYVPMSSSDQLCGQCHGNLRFPGTDHLSYNIEAGTGGIGVPDEVTMPGTQCVSCHMHTGDVDGTNALMFKGHRWSPFISEAGGSVSSACTSCHTGMGADTSLAIVAQWKSEFMARDSVAQIKVASADSFMQGKTDSLKLFYLAEAHHNLSFAESDESGGFHNHKYSMALLDDAIAKADLIVTGVIDRNIGRPLRFALDHNYPNPFNPSTTFRYHLKVGGHVRLSVFNVLGQELRVLIDEEQQAGDRSAVFDGSLLSSGVYYARLIVTDRFGKELFQATQKMLLIR